MPNDVREAVADLAAALRQERASIAQARADLEDAVARVEDLRERLRQAQDARRQAEDSIRGAGSRIAQALEHASVTARGTAHEPLVGALERVHHAIATAPTDARPRLEHAHEALAAVAAHENDDEVRRGVPQVVDQVHELLPH